jgi:hypothetical protein
MVRRRSLAATVLGLLSMSGLAFLWTATLAPLRWNLRFPGGGTVATLTLLLSIRASLIAGTLGKRVWLLITVIAVVRFAYA